MEAILEKIKKCLALSESSNENEAAVAIRQMNALLTKYNLTISDVQQANIVEREVSYNAGKVPFDTAVLVAVVADAFNCKYFTQKLNSRQSRIVFIGDNISAEIAEYAFSTLRTQLKRNKLAYLKQFKDLPSQEKKKNNLTPSKINRLGEVYAQAWASTVYTKCENISPDTSKLENIDSYNAKHHPNLATNDRKSRNFKDSVLTQHALANGVKDGEEANLYAGTGYTPQEQALIEANI